MSVLVRGERAVNLAVMAALWMALVGWQVATVRARHSASFGSLVAALRKWRAARLALLAGWMWLGWHFFVRTTY